MADVACLTSCASDRSLARAAGFDWRCGLALWAAWSRQAPAPAPSPLPPDYQWDAAPAGAQQLAGESAAAVTAGMLPGWTTAGPMYTRPQLLLADARAERGLRALLCCYRQPVACAHATLVWRLPPWAVPGSQPQRVVPQVECTLQLVNALVRPAHREYAVVAALAQRLADYAVAEIAWLADQAAVRQVPTQTLPVTLRVAGYPLSVGATTLAQEVCQRWQAALDRWPTTSLQCSPVHDATAAPAWTAW